MSDEIDSEMHENDIKFLHDLMEAKDRLLISKRKQMASLRQQIAEKDSLLNELRHLVLDESELDEEAICGVIFKSIKYDPRWPKPTPKEPNDGKV